MQIIINGQSRNVPDPLTIEQLLQHLQLESDQVVVEHNGKILARADLTSRFLGEDDRLEVVQFVGGG